MSGSYSCKNSSYPILYCNDLTFKCLYAPLETTEPIVSWFSMKISNLLLLGSNIMLVDVTTISKRNLAPILYF